MVPLSEADGEVHVTPPIVAVTSLLAVEKPEPKTVSIPPAEVVMVPLCDATKGPASVAKHHVGPADQVCSLHQQTELDGVVAGGVAEWQGGKVREGWLQSNGGVSLNSHPPVKR